MSAADNTFIPRLLLFMVLERLLKKWLLQAYLALINPVAVTLKRFLALDFDFNLGIFSPFIRNEY